MEAGQVNETPRHSVSVAAAIFDDSGAKVLLIKRRDNGNWEPPGGVLELDETIEDGLRREVREETGAEIEVGPLTGVYKNMDRAIIAMVFRCHAVSPPDAETVEATAIRWHSLADVTSLMTEAYSVRISDAATSERPFLRAHDGCRLLSQLRELTPSEPNAEPHISDRK
jgi:8-oxo-dGTP diphosphatase